MAKFDWKEMVRGIAPTLGAALGGPLGGMAAKVIADSVLGLPADADEGDIAAALAGASPDQLLALKSADRDFKVKMKELDINVFKLEVSDKDSARKLFMINIWPQILLSTIFIGGYIYIVTLFLNGDISIPDNVKTEFTLVLGVMTASVTQIMNFFFGSSFGSKEKTKALSRLVK